MKEKKVGILGGGQLARMLALKAHERGLKPYVLSSKKDDPAAQVTSFWRKGDIHKKKDLERFFSQVDIVTFENEFVDIEKLKSASKKNKVSFSPSLSCMKNIQNRSLQKKLITKYGLPTLPFLEVYGKEDLKKAMKAFPKGFVLKRNLFGYDGYGTFLFKKKISPSFLEKIKSYPEGFIAEPYLNFRREIAILSVRNKKGDIVFLPFCETKQKNSQCFYVKGPLFLKKDSLLKKIRIFLKKIDYVGVLALEFFEDSQGKIYINELAPRVHNSGHYSLDALSVDQFSYHLKAILNEPLSSPQVLGGFSMINLLGGDFKPQKLPFKDSQIFFHWYGKKDIRIRRKMGHITHMGSSSSESLRYLLKKYKEIKK